LKRTKSGFFPRAKRIVLPDKDAPPSGYEIVPRPEARALAAYLLSLRQDGYLFEAPPPPSKNKRRLDKRRVHKRSRGQARCQMNADDPRKIVEQDGPEPVAERWTVPMWLIVVFGPPVLLGPAFHGRECRRV
jgi:hypothetical protein